MSKGPISILHVNHQYIVNIGEKHLKDNPAFIHIDNKEILQEREGLFRNGSELIKQFKGGNYAFTRFQNNKKQLIENKISLDGFTDAFNDMEAQFSKLGADRNYSF
ncbi:invasion associated locus B family protein [Acinetobacter tibetensis]|uniref:Invasion associated locus B family protein n=1 Tax=Acinetobacter tibetensis TaxID=2943497 RepID=A0AAE9LTG3_9GAMM|nr:MULTISPECIES: invasion associated locus B family protein [Acinetobacter]USE84450.1 invasion associated locus B family protein [Acinetobacter tibetensis]